MKKIILLLIFQLLYKCFSQNIGDVLLSTYNDKKVFDKVLNINITTKDIFKYKCDEKEGYNSRVDTNIIIGLKLRKCDNEICPFFYFFFKSNKELHILTTYTIVDVDNFIEIGINNTSEVSIYDSTGRLKYAFLIPAVAPQSYFLKKYLYIGDSLICEKAISVREEIIINEPEKYDHYVKNHSSICELTISEYLNLIDLLKNDINTDKVLSPHAKE